MESEKGHGFLMKLQRETVDINCTKIWWTWYSFFLFYFNWLPRWVILFLLVNIGWFIKYIATFLYPCKEERVDFEYTE